MLWCDSVVEECAQERASHPDLRHAHVVQVAVVAPEHNGCDDCGNAIGGSYACPNTVSAPELREDDKERHKHHKLSAHGDEYALLGHADALEEIGHNNLETYYRRHEHNDFHSVDSDACQFGVIGEHHHRQVGHKLTQDE